MNRQNIHNCLIRLIQDYTAHTTHTEKYIVGANNDNIFWSYFLPQYLALQHLTPIICL